MEYLHRLSLLITLSLTTHQIPLFYTRPLVQINHFCSHSPTGLVTSICDTVLHGDELKGVACVDLRIADILGDLEYAQPGALSYSFIIDRTGRTFIHPLMPNPFKLEDDPIFLDISVLERAPEAQEVINSMKRWVRAWVA
jgi:hypothetical protein